MADCKADRGPWGAGRLSFQEAIHGIALKVSVAAPETSLTLMRRLGQTTKTTKERVDMPVLLNMMRTSGVTWPRSPIQTWT